MVVPRQNLDISIRSRADNNIDTYKRKQEGEREAAVHVCGRTCTFFFFFAARLFVPPLLRHGQSLQCIPTGRTPSGCSRLRGTMVKLQPMTSVHPPQR